MNFFVPFPFSEILAMLQLWEMRVIIPKSYQRQQLVSSLHSYMMARNRSENRKDVRPAARLSKLQHAIHSHGLVSHGREFM